MDREDVFENPFFKTLQSKYASLYNEAEKNCWLICVPHSSTLSRLTINNHVLRPSPIFQGVYEVHDNSSKTCEIEGNTIKCGTRNFKTDRKGNNKVHVLSEELFYNQEYKPYRAVLLDAPLWETVSTPTNLPPEEQTLPSSQELERGIQHLQSFPENTLVLSKIDKNIATFKDTYVLVSGFESDLRMKISQIVENATEMLLCTNMFFRKMQSQERLYRELSLIIESYVLLGLYDKVYLGIRSLHQNEDIYTSKVLEYHYKYTQKSAYGMNPIYADASYTSAAIVLQQGLSNAKTPLQMLYACEDTVNDIVNTIQTHLEAKKQAMEAVTTDDLIPLISYVIVLAGNDLINDTTPSSSPPSFTSINQIKSAPFKYFWSSLLYMEHFIYTDLSTTKLGYNLINFKGALTYLTDQIPHKISAHLVTPRTTNTTNTITSRVEQENQPTPSDLFHIPEISPVHLSRSNKETTSPQSHSNKPMSPKSSTSSSGVNISSSNPGITFQRAPDIISLSDDFSENTQPPASLTQNQNQNQNSKKGNEKSQTTGGIFSYFKNFGTG